MEQKTELIHKKRSQSALLVSSGTTSHIFDLQSPEFLQDYVDREKFFKEQPLVSALVSEGFPLKSLISLMKCGENTGAGVNITCRCSSKNKKIKFGCSNRCCPRCAEIRKRKINRKIMPLLRNLIPNHTTTLRFFTIAPKNYKSLSYGHEHIRKSIAKFWRRKYVNSRVFGGLYVLETKEKDDGTWNIHAHIIYYGRTLDNKLYGHCKACKRTNWLKYDNDSQKFYCSTRTCNSVNVVWNGKHSRLTKELFSSFKRDVRGHIKTISLSRNHYQHAEHTLNYCLKYISINKDDFQSPRSMARYMVVTQNRRLLGRFGSFFSHKSVPDKPKCRTCKEYLVITYSRDYSLLEELFPAPPPLSQEREKVAERDSLFSVPLERIMRS